MSTFIDLLGNDVWSDADITNRCRAIIESHVPIARQDELRTIMLGHIAKLRAATDAEMAEITLVKSLTEAAADLSRAARADMSLLQSALDYESAARRLAVPVFAGPKTATTTDEAGGERQHDNPDYLIDQAEREAALDVVSSASQATLDLVVLRNPPQAGPICDEVAP